jgi:hypothetical protein
MPGTRLKEHKAAIRKDTQQQYDTRPYQSRAAYAVRAGGAKAAAANVKAPVQSGRQYKCEHCANPDTNEQCAANKDAADQAYADHFWRAAVADKQGL